MVGRSIGIVGGGVGGLAVAVALRRAGFEVTVFERAADRRHHGAALLLWSNAINALRSLGLADAVCAISAAIATTEFRTWRGDLLSTLPIGEWSRATGSPTVATPRRALVELLAAALPDGVVKAGVGFTSFTCDGSRVRARFDDGSTCELDGLIGADGLRSRVRAQLHGEHEPRVLEHDAWVGIAPTRPASVVEGVTVATIGRGPRFWSAPLPGGAVFWYATQPRRIDSLAEYSRWHAPIGELIASTPASQIIRTPVCDRLPIERWGTGPVTLLGEAAHPSTPDLGQGACQAIESAVVLADALSGAPSVASGFREYEARRRSRTATISRLCWLTWTNSTIEHPALCAVRDATIRFGLRAVARGQLEWILGGPS